MTVTRIYGADGSEAEVIKTFLCENIIHLLHAGEGNMKIYSPKSIIFPEGIARGEYDTRG